MGTPTVTSSAASSRPKASGSSQPEYTHAQDVVINDAPGSVRTQLTKRSVQDDIMHRTSTGTLPCTSHILALPYSASMPHTATTTCRLHCHDLMHITHHVYMHSISHTMCTCIVYHTPMCISPSHVWGPGVQWPLTHDLLPVLVVKGRYYPPGATVTGTEDTDKPLSLRVLPGSMAGNVGRWARCWALGGGGPRSLNLDWPPNSGHLIQTLPPLHRTAVRCREDRGSSGGGCRDPAHDPRWPGPRRRLRRTRARPCLPIRVPATPRLTASPGALPLAAEHIHAHTSPSIRASAASPRAPAAHHGLCERQHHRPASRL